jgi:hypothetical protein
VRSPVSITTSTPNCVTTERMTSQAVGFRCRSLTCSTRTESSPAVKTGNALVTAYSSLRFDTRRPSWSW